ncbi:hypothetical protein [Bacillus sp. RS11]|uniref:hypothetical protein n=1 Tax=Lysinibacillus sp. RS11 TaxID=3242682 RepID=UPI0035C762E6
MNLTVNHTVWLAAAMMTYERFKNNEVKSIDDIALSPIKESMRVPLVYLKPPAPGDFK